jgi:integrase
MSQQGQLIPLKRTAAAGVGDPTIRKLMSIVQGVLQRAVEWHRLTTNPARAVRKPPQKRMRRIEPPAPLAVERMRARLRANGRLRDATLVCVLAYAGLRPGEALALEWQHIGERTILIEGAVALGNVKRRSPFSDESDCDRLPPIAPAWLHKRSIVARDRWQLSAGLHVGRKHARSSDRPLFGSRRRSRRGAFRNAGRNSALPPRRQEMGRISAATSAEGLRPRLHPVVRRRG